MLYRRLVGGRKTRATALHLEENSRYSQPVSSSTNFETVRTVFLRLQFDYKLLGIKKKLRWVRRLKVAATIKNEGIKRNRRGTGGCAS